MSSFASLNCMLRRLALPGLLVILPMTSVGAEQRTFATPEAAVEALIAALKANDGPGLVAIAGDKHKSLIVTGDAAYDAAKHAQAAALLETFHMLDDSAPDRRVLLVGEQAWPLPVPLVRAGSEWRFATEQGADELLNRRIGRNERQAIVAARAYVQAQREYASRDRDGDGVLQYALKLGSSPGKFDGLYWPADAGNGEEASPLGPLIAQSAAYFARHKKGDAYLGYRFRILTAQGPHAAGGSYNYLINGRLIAGFGMVAYPDVYGETGVATFVVNHNGVVFERNLGKGTEVIAGKMAAFDPGVGWKAVKP